MPSADHGQHGDVELMNDEPISLADHYYDSVQLALTELRAATAKAIAFARQGKSSSAIDTDQMTYAERLELLARQALAMVELLVVNLYLGKQLAIGVARTSPQSAGNVLGEIGEGSNQISDTSRSYAQLVSSLTMRSDEQKLAQSAVRLAQERSERVNKSLYLDIVNKLVSLVINPTTMKANDDATSVQKSVILDALTESKAQLRKEVETAVQRNDSVRERSATTARVNVSTEPCSPELELTAATVETLDNYLSALDKTIQAL